MRLAVLIFLVLVCATLVAAPPGNDTGDNGQGGGLPGLVDRVKIVEDVLNVQNVQVVEKLAEPKLFVGGTEYQPGDPGKIFVQLTDGDDEPVDDGTCWVKAWYANDTVFVDWTIMDHLEEGIYDYDFTVPEDLGVYPVSVKCLYKTIEGVFYLNQSNVYIGAEFGFTSDTENRDKIYYSIIESYIDEEQANITGNFTLQELSENLIGYYRFEEGSYNGTLDEVKDTSGFLHHGTSQLGTNVTGAGKFGQGAFFDGDDDTIEIGVYDEYNELEDELTIAMWFKPTGSYTQWAVPMSKGESGWGDWTMGVNIDDGWCMFVVTNETGSSFYNGNWGGGEGNLYAPDEWAFCAGVYNGTHSTLYVGNNSGTNLFSKTVAANGGQIRNTPANSLEFGRISAGDIEFNGTLDEVMIFKRAVSPEGMNTLWDEGDGAAFIPALDAEILFNNNVSNASFSGFEAVFNYTDREDEPLNIWVYNYTLAGYQFVDEYAANEEHQLFFTRFEGIGDLLPLRIKFNDTNRELSDLIAARLRLDLLEHTMVYSSGNDTIHNIRGGGEVHNVGPRTGIIVEDDTPLGFRFDAKTLCFLLFGILLLGIMLVKTPGYLVVTGAVGVICGLGVFAGGDKMAGIGMIVTGFLVATIGFGTAK